MLRFMTIAVFSARETPLRGCGTAIVTAEQALRVPSIVFAQVTSSGEDGLGITAWVSTLPTGAVADRVSEVGQIGWIPWGR